jgi:lysophospholipase L1-like esterase
MVVYCERIGAVPVLVIPPGNDAGFEPSRSVLPPETPKNQREAFARQVETARALEPIDPAAAIARYLTLIDRWPGFAETHFRLARLLQTQGRAAEAYRHYVQARDADAQPMRCSSDFQEAFREIARRHDVVLVDGQAVFHSQSPTGQLDDHLFNDAMHPSFHGQIALAEAILAGLKGHGAFSWPSEEPPPRIDPARCAEHFDITAATWSAVSEFSASFYQTTAPIRYDPAERLAKASVYGEVRQRLAANHRANRLHVPGLGIESDLALDSRVGVTGAWQSESSPEPIRVLEFPSVTHTPFPRANSQ